MCFSVEDVCGVTQCLAFCRWPDGSGQNDLLRTRADHWLWREDAPRAGLQRHAGEVPLQIQIADTVIQRDLRVHLSEERETTIYCCYQEEQHPRACAATWLDLPSNVTCFMDIILVGYPAPKHFFLKSTFVTWIKILLDWFIPKKNDWLQVTSYFICLF